VSGSSGGSDGGGIGAALRRGEPETSREVPQGAAGAAGAARRVARRARETGQPEGRIASWREEFLEAGREGLKSRPLPAEERELAGAQRKVGELQLENDPLPALLEASSYPHR
jgi:hypothetical protein